MTIEKKLEELSALVAVAASIAPEQFPSWSDGSAAHTAAISALWSEIRPSMGGAADGLDEKFKALVAAFRDGKAQEGMHLAGSLGADLANLR